MTHDHVIRMSKRFNSNELDIKTHPTTSLRYILKYSLIHQEYLFCKIISNEIDRRFNLNICERCNAPKEKSSIYCKKCEELIEFANKFIDEKS